MHSQLHTLTLTHVQHSTPNTCRYESVYYVPKDADSLMGALAQQPVVFYFATAKSFFSYKGGVINGSDCATTVNHAM